MIRLGASFQLCGVGNHLRIIISEPDAVGSILICNVTDEANDLDCLCVIHPGEHPKITKRSVIALRKLCLLTVDALLAAEGKRQIVFFEDFSAELVLRIQQAIASSPDVAPKFKRCIPSGA
jgi:hypothetical protein